MLLRHELRKKSSFPGTLDALLLHSFHFFTCLILKLTMFPQAKYYRKNIVRSKVFLCFFPAQLLSNKCPLNVFFSLPLSLSLSYCVFRASFSFLFCPFFSALASHSFSLSLSHFLSVSTSFSPPLDLYPPRVSLLVINILFFYASQKYFHFLFFPIFPSLFLSFNFLLLKYFTTFSYFRTIFCLC